MKFEICNFIHGSENKNISDVTIYQKLAKYLNDKYNKTVRLHKNINDSINCEILLKSIGERIQHYSFSPSKKLYAKSAPLMRICGCNFSKGK